MCEFTAMENRNICQSIHIQWKETAWTGPPPTFPSLKHDIMPDASLLLAVTDDVTLVTMALHSNNVSSCDVIQARSRFVSPRWKTICSKYKPLIHLFLKRRSLVYSSMKVLERISVISKSYFCFKLTYQRLVKLIDEQVLFKIWMCVRIINWVWIISNEPMKEIIKYVWILYYYIQNELEHKKMTVFMQICNISIINIFFLINLPAKVREGYKISHQQVYYKEYGILHTKLYYIPNYII